MDKNTVVGRVLATFFLLLFVVYGNQPRYSTHKLIYVMFILKQKSYLFIFSEEAVEKKWTTKSLLIVLGNGVRVGKPLFLFIIIYICLLFTSVFVEHDVFGPRFFYACFFSFFFIYTILCAHAFSNNKKGSNLLYKVLRHAFAISIFERKPENVLLSKYQCFLKTTFFPSIKYAFLKESFSFFLLNQNFMHVACCILNVFFMLSSKQNKSKIKSR